ncbi:MAG: class 1 fructose-bisphosphatase [bacterium]|nr:class 1 fructose-bisphosphatase [bacterium]
MVGKLMTIDRFIIEQQRQVEGATGEFSDLLEDIALAAKLISHHVNKAGLLDILGEFGSENVQGERQQKLDVIAHDTIIRMLDHGGHLAAMASEESEEIIPIPEHHEIGHYVINFDPLDGSSNIDANVSVGTIFSVHKKISLDQQGTEADCMQIGRKQVAAGYIVYGSSTMLVYTTGHGVHGFTLDPAVGEFLLSHPNMRIPERGKIYSCNEGNYAYWTEGTRRYVDYLKAHDPATKRPYTSRYVGSLVADIHRTLLYGGIFLYPLDAKDPKKPAGKLRLLYEAAPISMIVEQAGGACTDGRGRNILDLEPTSLHMRVPLIVGSKQDVSEYEEFINKFDLAPRD